MKIPKTSSIDGKWAKVGQDIKDGDRIQFLNGGVLDTEGKYGARRVFKILTKKKEEFIMSLNQTSLNNLVDGYGDESDTWKGKVASVFVIKQMVGDGLKNVCYLAPDGWEMNEDGEFGPKDNEKKNNSNDNYDEPISPDDIPF